MLLTEQQKTDAYPVASLEASSLSTEKQYYSNLDTGRVNKSTVSGYPSDTYTTPNDYIQKLNGNGAKIGASIVLKVMAGDKFTIFAKSWWNSINSPGTPVDPFTDLLNALNTGVSAQSSNHFTATDLSSNNAINSGLTNFLTSHTGYNSSRPKAFINWVLFDEQFKFVSSSSGFEQVGASNNLTTHSRSNLTLDKNGYLYIYVSNETPNIDVFFDNLQVTQVRGSLISEDHYYPFGERAFGICSEALNFGSPESQKKKYNGIEKENDLSIETYEARLRDLDGQVGRWWQVDPKIDNMEMWSPYATNYDNPVLYSDPLGDEGEAMCCNWSAAVRTFNTTQTIAGTIELAGGGPENPVADIAAGIVEVGGLLTAAVQLLFTDETPTTIAPGATNNGGSVPPVQIQNVLWTPQSPVLNPSNTATKTQPQAVTNQVQSKARSKSDEKLIQEAQEAKAKEEAKTRKQNQEAATRRANQRTGKSNQGTRGSHNNLKGGRGRTKQNTHEKAEARRAREQGGAQ